MSSVFHREATATEPDAVAALFHEIWVRFSFDPTVPGFSYRQRQDGDGQLTVVGLDLGGPFSSWGDTDVKKTFNISTFIFFKKEKNEQGKKY